VRDPGTLAGYIVAVRPADGDTESSRAVQLDRGPLTALVLVQGVPIDQLPDGTRLRLGAATLVELTVAPEGSQARDAGIRETESETAVPAIVVEPGSIGPGHGIAIASVPVPLTDVLDLHSFRPEETRDVVAAYLLEARQAGLGEVRIVHGRGRGVQRAAIRRALADAPGVASFADAPPARGGWGATIVRLLPLERGPET
jgi:Smr domain-containing protein